MNAPRSGLVAVLFTDLVGSTELMSRLGDRAFDELRRKHFAALSQVVAAHGGEEVKNTGDGVMAVFPSAAEAVEAAVAMQQAAARQRRTGPLAIRVGLAVGDATLEGGDVFGAPVVEAARLVAAAQPGQILTTAVMRTLARSRSAAPFIDVGVLQLKGLPDPVPVCEVGWQPGGAPVPMPALLTDIGRVFVGRDAEVERLGQLWKQAAAGERQVALVAGEPGVGKTRLAAELAAAAHAEGAVVLAGRCDEDLGVPYQPFVEALRHFVDHTPEDLAGQLGRYGGELVRLVPELSGRVPALPAPLRSDPETERYRLFDALAAWLAAASMDHPVLLVLDDLQWAAKPTLLLLRHVVRSSEPMGLLVIGTYRDTELGHGHPLVEVLADLRRQDGVDRLSLLGLDWSGVAAFMEQAAGHALDDEELLLARAIHEETEGNPFFVREVFRHLVETGAVERREGRWAARLPVEELGIPEGVREVVGRRLARLSKQANRLLQVAAVTGPEFELPVLQQAEGVDEEDLVSMLEEATRARLLIEAAGLVARYRFAHALVRDTLYQGLSAARRLTLHRRVAEAIEVVHSVALDDHLPALAHHWARAGPAAETAKVVHYATRAGDRALAQLAHHEAATYYRQALDVLVGDIDVDQAQRTELLISLGEAQRRAGDPSHREVLLEAARLAERRGDGRSLARAALANTRGAFFSSAGAIDTDRVAVLETALRASGDGDSPSRARLLAALGLELSFSGDREQRRRLSDEGVAIARRLGDPSIAAYVLLSRRYTIAAPDTLAERLANSAELVVEADRSGDPVLRAWAAWVRYRDALESANVVEADRHLDVLSRISDDLRQPTLRWIAAVTRAGRTLLAGQLGDARRAIDEAWGLGEACGQPDTPVFCGALECRLCLELGSPKDLDVVLTDWGPQFLEKASTAARGLVCLQLGRPDQARGIFEDLSRSPLADLPLNTSWLPTMVQCAILATELGYPEEAEILYELLTPYSDQFCVHAGAVGLGSVSYYLAVLAAFLRRFPASEGRFADSEATHSRIAAPAWLARTRLEWARMLLARRQPGDVDRAREFLSQALDTARELGLGNVERRAVALLQ